MPVEYEYWLGLGNAKGSRYNLHVHTTVYIYGTLPIYINK